MFETVVLLLNFEITAVTSVWQMAGILFITAKLMLTSHPPSLTTSASVPH